MPILLSPDRLADLLIDPREDLDVEIKNWLDLSGDKNAKATFAKAALAIANHGGGFVILGLERQPPASLFDVTLPVWRVGEAILHAERLADNLVEGPATVSFVVHYCGLAGRSLTSVDGSRLLSDGRIARQNQITLHTTVDVDSISPNLPEIVYPFLAPLYGLFDFFELPMSLVTEELAKMRRGNY